MIRGTPKANAIACMEITECNFFKGSDAPHLVARAAYLNADTGATMGSFTLRTWSKGTLAKLKELRQAIERDAAKAYLADGGVDTPHEESKVPEGLAAYLGKDTDAEQA